MRARRESVAGVQPRSRRRLPECCVRRFHRHGGWRPASNPRKRRQGAGKSRGGVGGHERNRRRRSRRSVAIFATSVNHWHLGAVILTGRAFPRFESYRRHPSTSPKEAALLSLSKDGRPQSVMPQSCIPIDFTEIPAACFGEIRQSFATPGWEAPHAGVA